MEKIFLWRSTSSHFACAISPTLAPVSYSICSKVAVYFPHPLISCATSLSVGRNGCLSGITIFGSSQCSFWCFVNAL